MTATRPDLSYIVTKLSQYMSKPTMCHLNMVRRVFHYLKATRDYSLVFRKVRGDLSLIGVSDSDWGSSPGDRRSTTGYCFKLSDEGPIISWKSRKQQTVALSTCEAEYMAASAAVQEAKFLLQLLSDFRVLEIQSSLLYVDNQGTLALAKNPVQHQRSKHIDIRYHFIRNEVLSGTIKLAYIPTDLNLADIFTKGVPRPRLEKLSKLILNT